MDWNKINLTLSFREGVAGSLPSGELAHRYADLLSAGASNEIKKALKEAGIVTKEDVEEYLKNCTTIFSADEEGFYLRPVQFIGMLCMSAARTKLSIQRKGMKATLIQGTTIIEPSRIRVKGKLNVDTRALTPQSTGRSTIKRTMVLHNVEPIDISVRWLDNGDITPEDMTTLFDVAQEIGVGGDRRFGYGKFNIDKLEKAS